VCKKSLTNSQPSVKKMSGPLGGMFLTHTVDIFCCFRTMHERDRQTDRQTDKQATEW